MMIKAPSAYKKVNLNKPSLSDTAPDEFLHGKATDIVGRKACCLRRLGRGNKFTVKEKLRCHRVCVHLLYDGTREQVKNVDKTPLLETARCGEARCPISASTRMFGCKRYPPFCQKTRVFRKETGEDENILRCEYTVK